MSSAKSKKKLTYAEREAERKKATEPKFRRPPQCRVEFRFLNEAHLELCRKAKAASGAKSMNAWIVQATRSLLREQLGQPDLELPR